MIGIATNRLPLSGSASVVSAQAVRTRRRIGPEAGVALERLGHAIEYLTDELINDETQLFRDDRLEAIELLMAVNRGVYFSCPEIPSLADRFHAFLRRLL